MATNWGGQYTGQSTGPNLANMYQQNQQPQGMSQQWRPNYGSNSMSRVGGSAIGSVGSKGGQPTYGQSTQYPQMYAANPYGNSRTNWQEGEGATVPMGNGNTTIDGTTYNSQGQQLDSLGNVAYGDWGSNNDGGGGGGGQGGIPRDGANMPNNNNNNNGGGGGLPRDGDPLSSGEGSTGGQQGGYGMPYTQQQYAAMNPQQQQTANNYMASQMPYMQFAQNTNQYNQDFAQAAKQWEATHNMNLEQAAFQQGVTKEQLLMQWDAQRFNQNSAREDTNMNWSNLHYTQQMGTRQQDWAEKQGLWGQQNWGADYVMRQAQQGHQQGMDIKGFHEGVRQFDVGQGNWQSQFGEGQRQFNVGQGNWQSQFGEGQRQFNVGQGNWQAQFGEGQRQFNVGQGNIDREFGEGVRRYDQGFTEDTRRFDVGQGNWQSEFGEGQRQFDVGQQFKEKQFGQQQYEFGAQMDFEQQKNAQQFGLAVSNQELDWLVQTGQLDLAKQQFGQGQYEFGAEMGQRSYEFDAAQRQQMAIEQARLAQAEKAANVAAVGRTLAPSAKWLRAT